MTPALHHDSAFSTRRQLTILLGLAAVFGGAFFWIAADVWHTNAPVGLDRVAGRLGITAGQSGPLRHNARLARMAEWVGSRRGVGLGALGVVTLALIWRDWIIALAAALSPIASFLSIEYVAKPLINDPVNIGGRMYPSGHTAGIAAVATTTIVLLYRRWGGSVAVVFSPLAATAVALVGLAVLRLELHHYPTDVLGGAVLGASVALALTALLVAGRRYAPPRRRDRPLST